MGKDLTWAVGEGSTRPEPMKFVLLATHQCHPQQVWWEWQEIPAPCIKNTCSLYSMSWTTAGSRQGCLGLLASIYQLQSLVAETQEHKQARRAGQLLGKATFEQKQKHTCLIWQCRKLASECHTDFKIWLKVTLKLKPSSEDFNLQGDAFEILANWLFQLQNPSWLHPCSCSIEVVWVSKSLDAGTGVHISVALNFETDCLSSKSAWPLQSVLGSQSQLNPASNVRVKRLSG